MDTQAQAPGIDTAATQAIVQQRLFDPSTPLQCIGRYRIVATLGRGGMGSVYAAFDPLLDRGVAIKLLHAHAADPEQLRSEARALAQLNHPNVVAVFEVGTHEGQLFVAMEQVQGQTLRAWLRAAHRRPRAVLQLLVQAGRALAAAHAVGIVHRDFKLDNAMLGDDGRVRVLDFGLAIASGVDGRESDGSAPTPAESNATGARIAGTPGYMAPELFAGATADARSDQYAFCVSAWEALCGVRPNSRVTQEPDRGEHPMVAQPEPALRRVLARGLEADPARRFASMDALLDALAQLRARRRRRVALGALGLVVAVASMRWGWQELDERRRAAGCAEAGESIVSVWPGVDDGVRTAVREGLLATGAGYAAATDERVEAGLDAYAAELATARAEVCGHAELARDWDRELVARADACLANRQLVLAGLVHRLPTADTAMLRLAAGAALSLPSVATCLDDDALLRQPAQPSGADDEIASVREHLASAAATRLTGRIDEMLESLESAVAQADRLAWVPLVVESRMRLSVQLGEVGQLPRAEAMMLDAYYRAAGAGLEQEAAHAAASLLALIGARMRRFEDGLAWAERAQLHRMRAGDQDSYLRTRLFSHLALSLMEMGELPLAHAYAELAAQSSRETTIVGSPEASRADTLLAAIRLQLGDTTIALDIMRRLADDSEAALGADHPDTAFAIDNLGTALVQVGRYDEARVLIERALLIRERSLPPDHPELVSSLLSLGVIEDARGEHASARDLDHRAYELASRVYGPEHPITTMALGNLASDEMSLGNLDAAREGYLRVCALREAALGPNHPDLARALSYLAATEIELARLDDAREHASRAIAIYESKFGPQHIKLASFLTLLGEAQLRAGQVDEARPVLERALALQASEPLPSDELAATRWALARVLWTQPRERARALSLAREAVALYREHPEKTPLDLAAVQAWLREHDGPR